MNYGIWGTGIQEFGIRGMIDCGIRQLGDEADCWIKGFGVGGIGGIWSGINRMDIPI